MRSREQRGEGPARSALPGLGREPPQGRTIAQHSRLIASMALGERVEGVTLRPRSGRAGIRQARDAGCTNDTPARRKEVLRSRGDPIQRRALRSPRTICRGCSEVHRCALPGSLRDRYVPSTSLSQTNTASNTRCARFGPEAIRRSSSRRRPSGCKSRCHLAAPAHLKLTLAIFRIGTQRAVCSALNVQLPQPRHVPGADPIGNAGLRHV